MFVDWRRVNAQFCGVMWMIAAVLAVVILVNVGKPSAPVKQSPRYSSPGLMR